MSKALRVVAAVLLALPAVAATPDQVGQFSAPFNWPIIPVHPNLLPNGKVLAWDSETNSNTNPRLFDPVAGTFVEAPYNNVENLFCSAHVPLSDGKIFVAGGHINAYTGLETATIFDPATNTWADQQPMAFGRWYPTLTKLPDGKMFVVSGATDCSDCTIPGAPHNGVAALPEIFNPQNGTWTTLGGASLRLPLYPHMYVLPDGRLFAAASQEDPIQSQALDLTTQTWSPIDAAVRDGGSSAMYLPGKIIKTGTGWNPDYPVKNATTEAWVIDMTQPSPTWRAVAPMAFARTQHTLTLLPDGTVLATGGCTSTDVSNTGSCVLAPEIWNPTTETWTTMATGVVPRHYHSSALLIPDGRVILQGGGHPPGFGVAEFRGEIYSPPYLFKGARPVISSVPSILSHGQSFFVGTPDGASIAKVTMIAQPSATHGINMNQRFLPLTFTTTAGGLNVTAPANANLAPPGFYMLFLVNAAGVPSTASWVRFPAPWDDSIPPSAPSNLVATPGIGIADLTWSAATDNVLISKYNVHRSTTPGIVPSLSNKVGESTGLAYHDQLASGGTFFYVVAAVDGAGNVGPPSNEASAAVTPDAGVPTAPTGFVAEARGAGLVDLRWNAASDDVGVTGYDLERCQGAGCLSFVPLRTVTGTSALDPGLPAATTFAYRVRARDAAGNTGGYSGVASTTTAAASGGLVGAWSFSEGGGSTAGDASGLVNNGTLTAAGWSATGKFGSALILSGGNGSLGVPDAASLDLTSGMTIEGWVKPTSAPSGWTALAHKDVDRYYLMASSSSGNAPAAGGTFTNGGDTVFGTTALAVGVWTHLATTFDGSQMKLYVDGALVATKARASTLTTSTGLLQIGNDSYGEMFPGAIDEVRIYNRALTQAEIQSDMSRPVADGVVRLRMGKNAPGNAVTLNWEDAAGNGVYRVKRAGGPAPADFSSGTCTVVTGTSYSDSGALNDGVSHYYRVEQGSSCP